MNKSVNIEIRNLARQIFNRQEKRLSGYTLILGAGGSMGSNCPSWVKLCEDYCKEYSVNVSNNDFVTAFKNELKKQPNNKIDTYHAFAKSLSSIEPSIGFLHLATLISKGVFKTIITTNFDNLLEKALYKIMPIEDIKVLIRGEVTDEYIADFIEKGIPQIKIVKLHGDLQSNIFFFQDEDTFCISESLKRVIMTELSRSGSIIVGSEVSDPDLLGIYSGGKIHNIFVNPKSPEEQLKKSLQLAEKQIISKENGKFDVFFTELNLEYQRLVIENKEVERKSIEKHILDKQEKGASYINYSRLGTMVSGFWGEIKEKYGGNYPNVIVFINDPSAPGGMELKRRMMDIIKKDSPGTVIETVKIEGDKTRYHDRHVTSDKPKYAFSKKGHKQILILDAISFSGNTMKIAIEKYKEWFPTYTVKPGIMVIDEQLKDIIEREEDVILKDIIYYKPTDRHEIFFPWGITQATKDCQQKLKGLDTEYTVSISKRPWGTIELLAQQKNCSIRILTIEADQKLSFQRHLVRDEFFISLDENIGLEICAEMLDNLSEDIDINEIKEIKSLVLEKGDYILIPKGIWHRTKASKERVRLLEIGYGTYDQDKDIERIADNFGRIDSDGSK